MRYNLTHNQKIAFDYTFESMDGAGDAILNMSRVSATMVLVVYILYLSHQLKSRNSTDDQGMYRISDIENQIATTTMDSNISTQDQNLHAPALPPRTIRFADEGMEESDENINQKWGSEIEDAEVNDPGHDSGDDEFNESRGRGAATAGA